MDGGEVSGVWSAVERGFGKRECLGFEGKGMIKLVHSDYGVNHNPGFFHIMEAYENYCRRSV